MKRKNGVLYTIFFMLIAYMLLTWLLPATTYSTEFTDQGSLKMGLTELFTYPTYTFYNFIYVLLFLLLVGGLYGILRHIPAYRRFLDKVVEKVKEREWFYTLLTIMLMTVVIAFTGFTYEVLAIMPFIASVALLTGRDKITAALMTVGPIAIGIIGNLYSTAVVGTFVSALGIEFKSLILFKVILLVLGIGFLFLAIRLHNKHTEGEEIDNEFYFIPEEVDKKEKVKAWPLATILGVFVFVKVIASIAWQSTFGITFFSDLKTKIDAYPLFSKLVGFIIFGLIIIGLLTKYIIAKKKDKKVKFKEALGKCGLVFFIISVVILGITTLKVVFEDIFVVTSCFTKAYNALGLDTLTIGNLMGEHATIGAWTYSEYITWLVILEIVLVLVYHVKPQEMIDNNGKGMKKVLYAGMVCMFAYVILVATSNNPIMLTILRPVIELITKTTVPIFRLFLYLFVSLISGFLNSDFAYFSYSVFPSAFASSNLSSNVLPLVALLHQGAIGLAMLIAPTSIPMVFTLTTLNISYKEWFKKVGLLFIALLGWLIIISVGVLLYLSI